MPKPLAAQPDDVPVHEQVRRLVAQAHKDRMAPVGIVFSRDGFNKARAQTVPGMDPWGRVPNHPRSIETHYLGLPFTVNTGLTTGDVLLDLVPGGSAEAKAFRAGTRDDRAKAQPVSFRVDHLDPRQTTMEIAGQALTAPQVCDLVSAWADANPNTDLAVALRDAVRQHGRFE